MRSKIGTHIRPIVGATPFASQLRRNCQAKSDLRNREDEAGPDAACCDGGDWVEGGPVPAPWVAIAGAVVAQRVDAVARALFEHAVREREDCTVKMGGRCGWLEAAFAATAAAATAVAALVTVAFEIGFFEVERIVVEAGGIPVVGGNGPAAGCAGAACLIDLSPTRSGQVGR